VPQRRCLEPKGSQRHFKLQNCRSTRGACGYLQSAVGAGFPAGTVDQDTDRPQTGRRGCTDSSGCSHALGQIARGPRVLIKIIRFKRKSRKRPADLRRLFLYLFTPKPDADPASNRLLGPPQLDHLVLNHMPWGDDVKAAADDLANQFDFYVREAGVCQTKCAGVTGCKGLKACVGRPRPVDWYAHVVFAFAPIASPEIRNPADDHKTPPRNASSAANAIRIARDVLDFLGWTGIQPAVFVAHGDQAHIHVHAVISTPVFDDNTWDIFRFSKKQLFAVAATCTSAFNLSTGTPMLEKYYKQWRLLADELETYE